MKVTVTPRLLWLLWLAFLALFIGNALYPVSMGITRLVGIVLLLTVWIGLVALLWTRLLVRGTLLGFSLLVLVFLGWPDRPGRNTNGLRTEYVIGLRRYEGVRYVWGGESPKGIDCSGLVRRGLIDASFLQGIRTLDGGLVRYSLQLWWHDCSAQALGQQYRGETRRLFASPSLNHLDHATILPGDFAVSGDGVHTLAYLGGGEWIEASPEEEKVIVEHVPAMSIWFSTPMQLVRWRVLTP